MNITSLVDAWWQAINHAWNFVTGSSKVPLTKNELIFAVVTVIVVCWMWFRGEK